MRTQALYVGRTPDRDRAMDQAHMHLERGTGRQDGHDSRSPAATLPGTALALRAMQTVSNCSQQSNPSYGQSIEYPHP